MVTSAATPKPAIDKLNALLNDVMKLPDVLERVHGEDMDAVRRSAQDFDTVRAAMVEKWSKIVKQTGIQGD